MSNSNYHPNMSVIENCVYGKLGRGNWPATAYKCVVAMEWSNNPWELIVSENSKAKSKKGYPQDPIIPGNEPYCGSSTDLSMLGEKNLIWLSPIRRSATTSSMPIFPTSSMSGSGFHCRSGMQAYPRQNTLSRNVPPPHTHSMEAIDNKVEHPDDREDYFFSVP